PVGWILRERAADSRVGIVEVAEDAGAGGAGDDTGRRGSEVDAGRQAQLQTAVNALVAEGAFLHDAARATRNLRLAPLRHGRVRFGEGFPVEAARTGRAGHLAIATADAAVVVHHHNTVRPVVGRLDRADVDTGRIFAVHAGNGQVGSRLLILDDAVPGDVW